MEHGQELLRNGLIECGAARSLCATLLNVNVSATKKTVGAGATNPVENKMKKNNFWSKLRHWGCEVGLCNFNTCKCKCHNNRDIPNNCCDKNCGCRKRKPKS